MTWGVTQIQHFEPEVTRLNQFRIGQFFKPCILSSWAGGNTSFIPFSYCINHVFTLVHPWWLKVMHWTFLNMVAGCFNGTVWIHKGGTDAHESKPATLKIPCIQLHGIFISYNYSRYRCCYCRCCCWWRTHEANPRLMGSCFGVMMSNNSSTIGDHGSRIQSLCAEQLWPTDFDKYIFWSLRVWCSLWIVE